MILVRFKRLYLSGDSPTITLLKPQSTMENGVFARGKMFLSAIFAPLVAMMLQNSMIGTVAFTCLSLKLFLMTMKHLNTFASKRR